MKKLLSILLALTLVVSVFAMIGCLEEPWALRVFDGVTYETEFRHFSGVPLHTAGWPRTPMR